MENSDIEAEGIQKSMQVMSIVSSSGLEAVAGPPHEALFLVLDFLPLYELLVLTEVCISLRDAVNNGVQQWLVVQRPLDWRLSDEILRKLSSKANGKLRTLALMNCVKVTDSGLLQVIEENPLINKLHIPGCIGLTPNGIIRAVEILSKENRTLKSLHVNGIYSIKKEHLETLNSYLKLNNQKQQQQRPLLYHEDRNSTPSLVNKESERSIDVEMCPRCSQVRVVFDCPKEMCDRKRNNPATGCRGCFVCIPRCAECSGCMVSEDQEEAACMDILCSNCWLQLPKCDFCDRPYCGQHANLQSVATGSTGIFARGGARIFMLLDPEIS